MTTTKHPENQQPQAGHDLGQISIKTLLENIEAWQERVADDMLHTKPGDPMHDYYDGQHAAFEAVAEFIKEQKKGIGTRATKKRYVVVEHPGTDREFQVFAADTYRACHLWMSRQYKNNHYPADIMVQNADGTLSTEI